MKMIIKTIAKNESNTKITAKAKDNILLLFIILTILIALWKYILFC